MREKIIALLLPLFLISFIANANANANRGMNGAGARGNGLPGFNYGEPPGLSKHGMAPPGLTKQGKTPYGWSKGKKEGWENNKSISNPMKSLDKGFKKDKDE